MPFVYTCDCDGSYSGGGVFLGRARLVGDALYESLIDVNVYTPEQYPAGWQTID